MIEDEELRRLFQAETDEHLQRLDEAVLRLEKAPKEAALLEEIQRELHSLKGAGRMLGLERFEALAHRLETAFRAIRTGTAEPIGAHADNLSAGLGALRALAAEAITGEPSDVDTGALAQALDELAPTPVTEPTRPTAVPHITAPAVPETAPTDAMPELPTFRIDTVRVETDRLDALMTLAGELTVVRGRLGRSRREMEQLEAWADEQRRPYGTRRGNGSAPALVRRIAKEIYAIDDQLERVGQGLAEGIRRIRLVPCSTLFRLFPRMVRDLARRQGKEARLVIEGEQIPADKHILERLKDPLMHLLSNAVCHGIEPIPERERLGKSPEGSIYLRARRAGTGIEIEVADDGRGLDMEAFREEAQRRGLTGEGGQLPPSAAEQLLFSSGFSTWPKVTEVAGRGVGLNVVKTNVEQLKGSLSYHTYPGAGFAVCLRLPTSLATTEVLLMRCAGDVYGIPIDAVRHTQNLPPEAIFTSEGLATARLGNEAMPVTPLEQLLGYPPVTTDQLRPCVIIGMREEQAGLLVDELIEEQEVLFKPYTDRLGAVRHMRGASILDTGRICLVLDAASLLDAIRTQQLQPASAPPESAPPAPARILLVEDSITTRAQERRILEAAGYRVVTAADGVEALNKLATEQVDAVVSDILMPRMGGLELTEWLRRDERYRELPVVLVTTLESAADRRRGMEAGASAYIPKHGFDPQVLLEALARLL